MMRAGGPWGRLGRATDRTSWGMHRPRVPGWGGVALSAAHGGHACAAGACHRRRSMPPAGWLAGWWLHACR